MNAWIKRNGLVSLLAASCAVAVGCSKTEGPGSFNPGGSPSGEQAFGPNAITDCDDEGNCVMTGCLDGWGNCDEDDRTGCETEVPAGGECGACTPGETRGCYSGPEDTRNIGECKDGVQTCLQGGLAWGSCDGEVLPTEDICDNGLNDDCRGGVDDGADLDGDGYGTCQNDCCDSPADGCREPERVNPGAFDTANNGIDDDCDGVTDNSIQVSCSDAKILNSNSGADLARAMDICQVYQPGIFEWGLVDASIVRADGTGSVDEIQTAVLTEFGPGVPAQRNATMAVLSSGTARAARDEGYRVPDGSSGFSDYSSSVAAPARYVDNHDGELQTFGDCPTGNADDVNDSVQLKLRLKAPSNAMGIRFSFRFFSSEAPEWFCSSFNDFFLAMLDSEDPTIPLDGNISFDENLNPVSVNNAFFTTCEPLACGASFSGQDDDEDGCPDSLVCDPTPGVCTIEEGVQACPDGSDDLVGYMEDVADAGATAWLTTQAPIVPGEEFELALHIWDTGDHSWDSLVLVDSFEWLFQPTTVATQLK